MRIGALLDVIQLSDKDAETLIGQARLMVPDVAQAVPPLDVWLIESTDPKPWLLVRPAADPDGPAVEVRDSYESIVHADHARRILAEDCPDLELLPGDATPVFLGLRERLTEEEHPCRDSVNESPLCRIACFSFCTSC